jgi:hypothetical protein
MWAHLLGLFTTKGLHLDGYAGAMSLPFPQKSLEFLRPGRQPHRDTTTALTPCLHLADYLREQGCQRSVVWPYWYPPRFSVTTCS